MVKILFFFNWQILCNGTRHYVSTDGEYLLDTDEKLHYAPSGMENTRIGNLQENFNYSCTVQEDISSQTQILRDVRSDPCKFSTDYGGILCSSQLMLTLLLLFNIFQILNSQRHLKFRSHEGDDQ
jgi:hypothetical protein